MINGVHVTILQAKRPRMISDDDDSQETNGKNGNSNGASSSSQSSSGVDDDIPASENVEARLDCLQIAFPKKVNTYIH